jgi:hypothetical protein
MEGVMQVVPSSVRRMFVGTTRERIAATLTLVAWFAMGAYVLLAIDYHFGPFPLPEDYAAVFGGVVGAVVAVLVKAA